MNELKLEIWVERIGEPTQNVWCPRCRIPAGIEASFAMGHEDKVMKVCRRFYCPFCLTSVDLPQPVELVDNRE